MGRLFIAIVSLRAFFAKQSPVAACFPAEDLTDLRGDFLPQARYAVVGKGTLLATTCQGFNPMRISCHSAPPWVDLDKPICSNPIRS